MMSVIIRGWRELPSLVDNGCIPSELDVVGVHAAVRCRPADGHRQGQEVCARRRSWVLFSGVGSRICWRPEWKIGDEWSSRAALGGTAVNGDGQVASMRPPAVVVAPAARRVEICRAAVGVSPTSLHERRFDDLGSDMCWRPVRESGAES